jgi:hypothetical protein
MTTPVTVGTFVVGVPDNAANVAAAASAYENDGTYSNKVAYNAALANAAALLTSAIPGEGAAFAANAFAANLANLVQNGESMNATSRASLAVTMAGDLVTMVGQGVEFLGLAASTVSIIAGGATFTVGGLINALGFALNAAGAGLDSATIANAVQQALQNSGLTPDSSGNYTVSNTGLSDSNFICDASNAASMLNISQGNNTYQQPTATDPNNVATVTLGDDGSYVVISPGLNGTNLNLNVDGNSDLTVGSGSNGGTLTIDNGTITASGNANPISAGASDVIAGASNIRV